MPRNLLVPIAIFVLVVVDLLIPPALGLDEPLRGVLAIPIVLLLPGYTVTLALFRDRSMDALERLVFAVGISLVLLALEGLVLNATLAGITDRNWGRVVAASILVPLAAVILRGLREARRGRVREEPRAPAAARPSISRRDLAYAGAGATMMLAAGALAVFGAVAQPQTRFTQLWLVPSDDPRVVEVGVRGYEDASMTYRLEVSQGGRSIRAWPVLTVDDGDTWRQQVRLDQPRADGEPLVARLYRSDGQAEAYRTVVLDPATRSHAGDDPGPVTGTR